MNGATVTENLSGAADVMLGRPSGLSRVDLSFDGFKASFLALLAAGLIDASAYFIRHAEVASRLSEGDLPVAWSRGGYALGNLSASFTAYLVSILIIVLLAREAERPHVASMVTVSNWAAPMVSAAMFMLIALEAAFAALSLAINLSIIGFLICILIAGWQITTITLHATPGRGAALFAASWIASLITVLTLERMLGLSAFTSQN